MLRKYHLHALLAVTLVGCSESKADSMSPYTLPLELLRLNADTPEQIAVTQVVDKPRFDKLEPELTEWRRPLAEENERAMRSLSYYVKQSPLGECSQLCGLKVTGNNRIPGQFMTFTCNQQPINLREFYPTQGHAGLALPADKINLLINKRPAQLQRLKSLAGSEATLLAWEGADRGFALFAPSASEDTARELIEIARAIDNGDAPHDA